MNDIRRGLAAFSLLLGCGPAFLFTTVPADAADMAPPMYTKAALIYAKAPPIPALYDWSGWHVGINGGYSWRDPQIELTPANASTASTVARFPGVFPSSVTVDPKGGLIGGQIGYDRQSGSLVWGIETDLDFADIKSAGATTGVPLPFAARPNDSFTVLGSQKLSAFGTLRGRLGVTPTDRALLYATGGLAYGLTTLNASLGDARCINFCAPTSSSNWKAGWTVGAGLEWALAQNWSVKGEYLFYDLGSVDRHLVRIIDHGFSGAAFDAHATFRGHIARIGVNCKFSER
jgi:outer membrane immunogenic protein